MCTSLKRASNHGQTVPASIINADQVEVVDIVSDTGSKSNCVIHKYVLYVTYFIVKLMKYAVCKVLCYCCLLFFTYVRNELNSFLLGLSQKW